MTIKKNAKIFIAGHSGLVGSAIVRRLKEAGYKNLIFRSSSELDLTNQARTDTFFAEEKPEAVYSCAALVGGIHANNTYPADFIYKNLAISLNVIQSARKHGVRKLLNFGSACMYPREATQPIHEDDLLSGPVEPTNEAYAMAKIASVKMCHYFNRQYGTNFISVAPVNQYGPGDNFNMENGHVLPMLLRRFHIAKLLSNKDHDGLRMDFKVPLGANLDRQLKEAGGPEYASIADLEKLANSLGAYANHVVVWGDGSARREFMFSEDLADACVFLMENHDADNLGEVINIASGHDILMKEAIELARKTVEFEGSIKYDATKPNGMPRKMLDSSKMSDLGWLPQTDLKKGLRLTYQAYLENSFSSQGAT